MLEFPRWKYVVILIVLALSALYALPNIYQKDPAIQITANRGGQIDDALRDRVLADLKRPASPPSVPKGRGKPDRPPAGPEVAVRCQRRPA